MEARIHVNSSVVMHIHLNNGKSLYHLEGTVQKESTYAKAFQLFHRYCERMQLLYSQPLIFEGRKYTVYIPYHHPQFYTLIPASDSLAVHQQARIIFDRTLRGWNLQDPIVEQLLQDFALQ